METYNPRTEKLLVRSAKQYRKLKKHTERLYRILDGCDYSKAYEHAVSLQQLQTTASQQDELLIPLIEQEISLWQEHPLFLQRLECIKFILELNELLVPRIHGMMAVIAAEMEKINEGRVVLAGYAAPVDYHRDIRGIG